MDNFEIRKKIKEMRKALSKEQVLNASEKILKNALTLDFSEYKNFFIYKSFNKEVDTSRLIEHFLSQNKMVAYPVIKGENMVAGIAKSDEKAFSQFGTEEPTEYIEMQKIDVCFLPLLAFDKNKNRLGYGKGYYDKFLSANPCLKIGLAYDFQFKETIGVKPWDVPLDIIITETKIIK